MPVRFKRFKVSNFKSLKSAELDLGQLNILLGRNASGKTNVLELFKFAFGCLRPVSSPATPFAPWWGYGNIVWGGKEDQPVSVEFDLDYFGYDVTYRGLITGYGGRLGFVEESLVLNGVLQVRRAADSLSLSHDPKFIEEVKVEPAQLTPRPGTTQRPDLTAPQTVSGLPITQSMVALMAGWSASYPGYRPNETDPGKGRLPRFAVGSVNIQIPASGSGASTQLYFASPVAQLRPGSPGLPGLNSAPVFPNVLNTFSAAQVLMLGQLNPVTIRGPSQVGMVGSLEHGDGLVSTLFNWFNRGGGKLPERIEAAMKELFPDWGLAFEITQDGRVFMTVKEGDLILQPPSIPDGLYKMLSILIAIEQNPSVLLIDEFDTSLHARMVEYLLDVLRSSKTTTIISSHSSTVVDLSLLEEIVLVEKVGHETKLSRVHSPEDVRARLQHEGVTVSESWLYGKLV